MNLEVLNGEVESFNAISKNSVQVGLKGMALVIELTVSEPWVINKGDQVAVMGERDPKSGKFVAFAYKNQSKGVWGRSIFQAWMILFWSGVVITIGVVNWKWLLPPLFLVPLGIWMFNEFLKARRRKKFAKRELAKLNG